MIGGEAGVGKTRLICEFTENARDQSTRVLTGGCLELGADGLPFAPFTAVLRELHAWDPFNVTEDADLGIRIGQKGSSAMPHKRNPIKSEQISGLARVLRGNAQAALENVALWHERDISHSSVERVILPDSTILLDYLQFRTIALVEGMTVHDERMRKNLELTHGALFSQRVLLALIENGMARDDAYRIVQELAQRAWDEGTHLRELLAHDERAAGLDLEEIFAYDHYVRYAEEIVRRLDGLSSGS